MKIRCDFWPLPGSSATLIAGNKAWHTAWNTDKHVVMPHTHTHTHTKRQRQSRNGAISMHISPDRDLRHTFISQTHSSCQATRSRLYLPACPAFPFPVHALPPPLVLIFISVLRKFQPHTPYYAKCKAWRIDKINKYENLRQNFFVFWQFT